MHSRISSFLGAAIVSTLAAWLLGPPMPASAQPPAAPASFAIITVTTTADEYDAAPNTECSLREAIQSQNDNANFGGCFRGIVPGPGGTDTILLPSGAYPLTRTGPDDDLNVTGDLDLRQSIILSATSPLTPEVLGHPSWDDRLLHVLTGTVTLRGLAFMGGRAGDHAFGGGMLVGAGATVSVIGGSFTHSSAYRGGGLYNQQGVLTLINTAISFNRTPDAYGADGAGIFNQAGHLTLVDSTVNGNQTGTDSLPVNSGGGIYSGSGTLALTGVTLMGNSSQSSGGAITVSGGEATLTNTTVFGNGSGHVGGGLYRVNAPVTATNVTFSNNSAPIGGAAIYSHGTNALTAVNVIVAGSLLSGNCGPDTLAFPPEYNNLSSDATCDFGPGRTGVGILLGPLAENGGPTSTLGPLPGSLAIDGGTSAGCPATDQRGLPRPQGAACDVGAVEVEAPPLPVFMPLVKR